MDAKEIERRTRDLGKATNESPSTLLSILADLSKNVVATEEILRSTKVGKVVNRLKIHKDPAVARASADLVTKWKKDMKGETSGKKAGEGAATATAQDGKSNASGEASGVPQKDGEKRADGKGFQSGVPLDQRSSKTDGMKTDVTGNTIRDSCLMLMYDGLANMSEESPTLILSTATAVEAAAFSHLSPETSPAYKSKIRSLFQNLKSKSNPMLRVRVLSGDITPERFVRMTLEELKSPERREEDKLLQKINMDKAMVAQEEKSISSALTCSKCKQKKVSYSQAQTRSADEPMTTFCECTVCGNRWKFS